MARTLWISMYLVERSNLVHSQYSAPMFIVATLILLLLALVGCATTNNHPTSTLVCGNNWTKGRAMNISLKKVDGQFPPRVVGTLPPGHHNVSVDVTWSNRETESVELQFEAQPEKWYLILAYELRPDEAREKADIRPFNFKEEMGVSILQGFAEGSAPLWLPFAAAYLGLKSVFGHDSPTIRPFGGCCFVWIQEDGTVIAGEHP